MGYKYIGNVEYVPQKVWDASIGLQQVDDLQPSKYMLQLIDNNINGVLTIKEINELLYKEYEDKNDYSTQEADIVALRIAELLSDDSFKMSPETFLSIHRYLFCDINPGIAGFIRELNLTKDEPILNGETVKYANWFNIKEQMKYDFNEELNFDYSGLSTTDMIRHFAEFTRNIWQTHPFMEGNTRTTAVFMEKYLNSKGFLVDNDLFKEKSKYFRNALVRANYANYPKNIIETTKYLEKFYENLLFDGHHELTNKELICFDLFREQGDDGDPGLDDIENIEEDGFDPGDDD